MKWLQYLSFLKFWGNHNTIKQETFDDIINEMFHLNELEREKYIEEINNLSMIIKAIVLANGGKLELSQNYIDMISENESGLHIDIKNDSLILVLE